MNTNQKIAATFLTARVRLLLVAVLSVTFGISMYVFMNSFMSGVNNEQTEMTFTAMPHIKIYNELPNSIKPLLASDEQTVVMVNNARNIRYTEGIKNADAIIAELNDQAYVAAVTAQLNQNVFIRNGVSKVSATLSGIQTDHEDALFGTSNYIIAGDYAELERRSDGIILGSGLAQKLGVNVGSTVNVSTSDGASKTFKVVGLSETGAVGADRSRAMVSIQTARQLFSANKSYATEILVNVQDYNQAPIAASQIENFTEYKVEPWQEGNSQLEAGNVLRDLIAIAVSLTILLVAGFGIYNIMNMTVNEKIKEIAILNAMGFNGRDVIEIFLSQSVVIGFIGGLSGLILGNIICRIIDVIPFEMPPLENLPIDYNPVDYIMAFGFGIIITFLAGYLPARKASKLDPVDVLRG